MSEKIIVSVCSPIHNEVENIPALVARVSAVMTPLFGQQWEQILVDDASTDGSNQCMQALQARFSTLKLHTHSAQMKERAAWQTAFDHACGDVVVLMAGDLQAPPEEIPKLLKPVLHEGLDVGTGFRQNRKDGFYYWLATRLLNAGMRLAFDLNVKDASSSFFAVRRKFVQRLPMIENDHRYILAIFKQRNATIKEVACHHAARVTGQSHYKKTKVLHAIPEIFRFYMRYKAGHYHL